MRRLFAAILLALLFLAPALAREDRPVRKGPDLISRWKTATQGIGSIELIGLISGAEGPSVLVSGRFGAGSLAVAMRTSAMPHDLWNTIVRLRGDEVEVEETLSGWVVRQRVSEAKIPITEEGDLFALLPPVSTPLFLGEDEDGTQRWEYTVKGGYKYRVTILPAPLRILRRDLITPEGVLRSTFLYSDYYAINNVVAIPRRILIEAPDGARLLEIKAERVEARPPLPPLEPRSRRDENLFRVGEKIVTDTTFVAIAQATLEATDTNPGRLTVMLTALDQLEKLYGIHPLLDCQRARLALLLGDTRLAGSSARSAVTLGRVVLPLAAQVGAMELSTNGDSSLLLWTLSTAAPRTPGDFITAESLIYGLVTEIAANAFLSESRPEMAQAVVDRAFLLDPTNRRIADLAIGLALAQGDEFGAVAIGYLQLQAHQESLSAILEQGDLLERLNRAAEAESLYAHAINARPDEPILRLRLGFVQLRRKNWIAAEESFDRLVSWMERSTLAAERRADIANEIANAYAEVNIALGKARQLINFALAVSPNDPYYLDTLGLIQLRNRNRVAAVMTFERALGLLDDPAIRAHLEQAKK